jgi:hypothetical protein
MRKKPSSPQEVPQEFFTVLYHENRNCRFLSPVRLLAVNAISNNDNNVICNKPGVPAQLLGVVVHATLVVHEVMIHLTEIEVNETNLKAHGNRSILHKLNHHSSGCAGPIEAPDVVIRRGLQAGQMNQGEHNKREDIQYMTKRE